MTLCRCGYDGNGPHPCHGNGHTCRKPATHRFYGARPAAVAGMQMKLAVSETWACDACWRSFLWRQLLTAAMLQAGRRRVTWLRDAERKGEPDAITYRQGADRSAAVEAWCAKRIARLDLVTAR